MGINTRIDFKGLNSISNLKLNFSNFINRAVRFNDKIETKNKKNINCCIN